MTERSDTTGMPLSHDLLQHAGALRRLARGILGDAHAAEDVVQETWVRALERPPSRPGRDGTLSGWLASVARSLALRKKRGDGRRGDRDARIASDASAAAITGADARGLEERRRALASLTDAVLALDEPYQSAILLRFYDDLPPRAVAARLGVPVATAKSRIGRGLAKLRERLDGELGSEDDPDALLRALAFLALPAMPVAPPEPRSNSTGPTGAGAAAAAAGAIAMGVQGKIAAGLAAAALVGFATVRGLEHGGEPSGPGASPRGDAAARPDVALTAADSTAPSDAAQEEVGEEDARRAAEAGVVDAGEPLLPAPYELAIDGRVLDDDDLPVEGAEVYAAPLGVARNLATRTDADGRFHIAWRGPTPAAVVALSVHAGASGSTLRRVRAAAGGTQVAVRLGSGRIEVVVRPERQPEEPAIDARLAQDAEQRIALSYLVLSSSVRRADRPPWAPDMLSVGGGEQAFALWPERCPSDAGRPSIVRMLNAGEFEGSARVVYSVALEGLVVRSTGAPEPAEPEPATSLAGVVRDAGGEPVPEALVVLGSAPGRGDGPRTRTDAEGAFELTELEPGAWFVRAGGGEHGVASTEVVIADALGFHGGRWDAWLDREYEVRGELVDAETGAPLEGWIVTVYRGDEELDAAGTSPAGRFRIPNAGRDAVRLVGRPKDAAPGAERVLAASLLPRVAGDDPPPVLPVDRASDASALLLALVDEEGEPIPAAEVRAWNLATGFAVTAAPDAEGACRLAGPLPAGLFEIEILAPGRAPRIVGPLRVGGPGEVDLQTIALDAACSVRVAERGADHGDDADRWVASVWSLRDEARVRLWSTAGRLPEQLHLPAGRYALELTPNAEHAIVADLIERGRAPAGARIEFEARLGGGEVLAIGRAAGGVALALEDPPEPRPRRESIESPTPEQLESWLRRTASLELLASPIRDGACARCH